MKKRFLGPLTLLLVGGILSGCAVSGRTNVVLVNPPANAVIVERDFSDIPRYPAATLVKPQKVPLRTRAVADEWATWEVAVYRTDDPVDKVVAFYEQEMLNAGWRGQWTHIKEGRLGSFNKDEITATISISAGAKTTSVVIVRAVRR